MADEVLALGPGAPGAEAYTAAHWLERRPSIPVSVFLTNSLDRGEAAVIQTAADEAIPLVCMDETVGRRIARLHGLTVTGSVGILIKAQQRGFPVDLAEAVQRMREHGIWLSESVIRFALEHNRPPV